VSSLVRPTSLFPLQTPDARHFCDGHLVLLHPHSASPMRLPSGSPAPPFFAAGHNPSPGGSSMLGGCAGGADPSLVPRS